MPSSQRVLALAAALLVACAAPASPIVAAAPAPVPLSPAPAAPPSIHPRSALASKIDPIFADFTREGAPSPGCAVGVYRAGEVLFSKGYGYADVEHDAPITDTTPFYTASLSKQFTAAAVLMLAAEGKVSLGDDVRKYVPELPDFGRRITLDHLLHHTSGLRDYHLLLLVEGLDEEDVITSREILWLLSHQRTLDFPPGSHFSYTSSGYVLLAEIVARVSGESFHAFLTRRVLEPLGMASSLVREDHARLIPHRAIGYTRGPDGQPRMLMGNLEYDGSSNFVTTVQDLARWDANFYEPKVGGQPFIDGMRVRGKLSDGTVLDYAMGLEEWETHGLHVEEHNGSFAGYRTTLVRYPAERLTVSVLCNTTEADADALAGKVGAVFLPQLDAPEPAAPESTPRPAPFGFDLATVAGTYIDLSTAEMRSVDVTDGVLRMRYGRSSFKPRELVPAGPGDLFVKGGHTHYGYEPAKGTQAARLVRRTKADLPQTFVRSEPVERVENLGVYTGLFGSPELPRDLEVRVEGGRLVTGSPGGAARATLAPVARDLFAYDDVGWRFERDARHRVVRLFVSTDRAREVVLVKRQEPVTGSCKPSSPR
ncbi:MAG TPA: serine hydrolase domain-containing protein [Polyangiaceae bacterium]